MLLIIVINKWKVRLLDIKSAFLYGNKRTVAVQGSAAGNILVGPYYTNVIYLWKLECKHLQNNGNKGQC